jgi:very-short-patch-repair endonuclease
MSVDLIKLELKSEGIPFVSEHRFDKVRRFRFDIALVNEKVAIEYEGIFSKKSRHTTVKGFTTDCEKYNLAIKNGWRVLRYTQLNYGQAVPDLKELLTIKQ